MAELQRFGVDDLVTFSSDLRVAGDGATTMVDAACAVTRYLHANLLAADGSPACALVRAYKTHRFEDLPPERQATARQVAPDVEDGTQCMTLLSSNGDPSRPAAGVPEEWVLPFTDHSFRTVPLIPQILTEIGLDLEAAVDPHAALDLRVKKQRFNVFLDDDLANSPLLPDPAHRRRVVEIGLQSLAVVGGILPSGELLLVMWHGLERIPERVADLFRSLGLAIEAALIPFTYSVFEPGRRRP